MVMRRSVVDSLDDPTDPALLTPDQRLTEVTAILARGALRLCASPAIAGADSDAQNYRDSSKCRLAISAKKRLHVQRG